MTVSPEDGPVSLLPVEVEPVSIKQEILDAELALQEWRMMQVGTSDCFCNVPYRLYEPQGAAVLRLS